MTPERLLTSIGGVDTSLLERACQVQDYNAGKAVKEKKGIGHISHNYRARWAMLAAVTIAVAALFLIAWHPWNLRSDKARSMFDIPVFSEYLEEHSVEKPSSTADNKPKGYTEKDGSIKISGNNQTYIAEGHLLIESIKDLNDVNLTGYSGPVSIKEGKIYLSVSGEKVQMLVIRDKEVIRVSCDRRFLAELDQCFRQLQ